MLDYILCYKLGSKSNINKIKPLLINIDNLVLSIAFNVQTSQHYVRNL